MFTWTYSRWYVLHLTSNIHPEHYDEPLASNSNQSTPCSVDVLFFSVAYCIIAP